MSENTDHCQLATTTVVSSPSTNNNTKRIFLSTSSQFSIIHNESFTPSLRASPIVADVCMGSQNGVRNAATMMKIRENETTNDNEKYSFTLSEKKNFFNNSMSENPNRTLKSHFYTLDVTTKDEENLHSPPNVQFSDNHYDIDTLSDAGTYIIEDDESEQKIDSSSSSFKRYGNKKTHPHGTFDIRGLISPITHTIHRPIVDSNISNDDLSSLSTSNSSLLSLNEGEETFDNKSSLQEESTPPQKQIKAPESFIISPIFETKSFPTTNVSRRNIEASWKSKFLAKSLPTKDSNLENSTNQSISPPHSANSTEKYSFHLQKQSPPFKTSIRPHTSINNQTTQNLTKVYGNRSSVLRQQRSNLTPSTSKPLKSLPSSIIYSNSQTNRAVELRRARAQAKIEELSQRTKKSLHKPNHQIDLMSASWHSNTNKKDFTNLRTTTTKTNIPSKQQDMSVTRTISSSSANQNPSGEIHERQINKSPYGIDGERCDSLRDNGQRLAIKLIQLSSGILEKLKPNDDVSVRELEQLVDQLQTVNQTLTSIDASLTSSTHNDTFV